MKKCTILSGPRFIKLEINKFIYNSLVGVLHEKSVNKNSCIQRDVIMWTSVDQLTLDHIIGMTYCIFIFNWAVMVNWPISTFVSYDLKERNSTQLHKLGLAMRNRPAKEKFVCSCYSPHGVATVMADIESAQ